MPTKHSLARVGALLALALATEAFGSETVSPPAVEVESPTAEVLTPERMRAEVAVLLDLPLRRETFARFEDLYLRHRSLLEEELARRAEIEPAAKRLLGLVADIPPSADVLDMWRATRSLAREAALRRKLEHCRPQVDLALGSRDPPEGAREDLRWLSWHAGTGEWENLGSHLRFWREAGWVEFKASDPLLWIAHRAGLSGDPRDLRLREVHRAFSRARGPRRRLLHQILTCCSPPEVSTPAWPRPDLFLIDPPETPWPRAPSEPRGLIAAWSDALAEHSGDVAAGAIRLRMAQLFYVDSEAEPEVRWTIDQPLEMGETVTVRHADRWPAPRGPGCLRLAGQKHLSGAGRRVLTVATLILDDEGDPAARSYWSEALARELDAFTRFVDGAEPAPRYVRGGGREPWRVKEALEQRVESLRGRLDVLLPFLGGPAHDAALARLSASLRRAEGEGSDSLSWAFHSRRLSDVESTVRAWRRLLSRPADTPRAETYEPRRSGPIVPPRIVAAAARACEERGLAVPLWIREELGVTAGAALTGLAAVCVAVAVALLILGASRRDGGPWPAVLAIVAGILLSAIHLSWDGKSLFAESIGLLLAGLGAAQLAHRRRRWAGWGSPALLVLAAVASGLYQMEVAPALTAKVAPWLVLTGLLVLPFSSRSLVMPPGSEENFRLETGFVTCPLVAAVCILWPWTMSRSTMPVFILPLGLFLVAAPGSAQVSSSRAPSLAGRHPFDPRSPARAADGAGPDPAPVRADRRGDGQDLDVDCGCRLGPAPRLPAP